MQYLLRFRIKYSDRFGDSLLFKKIIRFIYLSFGFCFSLICIFWGDSRIHHLHRYGHIDELCIQTGSKKRQSKEWNRFLNLSLYNSISIDERGGGV